MSSCVYINSSVCYNHGQCIDDNCDCNNVCYIGLQWETSINRVDLPFPPAILQDHPSTHVIYIILINILVYVALVNDIFALTTL